MPIFLPMVNIDYFRQLALSFPDTVELPHFDLTSFRYKKMIFATFHEKDNRAMIKLTPLSQSVFCSYDKSVFFPLPGGWGTKGATFVELPRVRKDMFKDALTVAYQEVAAGKPKKK